MPRSRERPFGLACVIGLLVAGLVVLDLHGGDRLRALRDLAVGLVFVTVALNVCHAA